MTRSFFDPSPNDQAFSEMPLVLAVEFMERAARRVVVLEGPLATAVRLQRLADICSGAHVLPIDHWRTIGAEDARPKESRIRPEPLRRALSIYALGIAVGVIIGLSF